MKKNYLAVLAVTAILGLAASGSALAALNSYNDGLGIAGSPHDFSDNVQFGQNGGTMVANSEQWNYRKEICRTCHSPHDKQREAYKIGLLWNRSLSEATYVPFVMSEKAGNKATIGQPVGRAKMCLSCHDNTVALGSFDDYADGGVDPETSLSNDKPDGAKTFQEIYADGHYMIGQTGDGMTLEGTHPISVSFAAGYRLNPVTTAMGPSSGTIADVLDNGMVQCSSCHDVHNRVSVGGTRLLRQSQKAGDTNGSGNASGLCLTCHDK